MSFCFSGVEFEGFQRHGKQLVPHAHEDADGNHVKQAAILRISSWILPGFASWRLTTVPDPGA